MTASATAPAREPGRPAPRPATQPTGEPATQPATQPTADQPTQQEFQLVESPAGWRLTMTLTDRLREALARGGDVADVRFTVRVAPNLVPGDAFEAELVIEEPRAQRS